MLFKYKTKIPKPKKTNKKVEKVRSDPKTPEYYEILKKILTEDWRIYKWTNRLTTGGEQKNIVNNIAEGTAFSEF